MAGSSRNKTMAIPAMPPSEPMPFPRATGEAPPPRGNVATPFVSPSVPPPPMRPSVPPPMRPSMPPPVPAPAPVSVPSSGAPWHARPVRGPDAARPLLEVEPVPVRRVEPGERRPQTPPALELATLWTDDERLPEAVAALPIEVPRVRGEKSVDPATSARRVVRRGPPSSLAELVLRLRDADGAPPHALVAGILTFAFDVRAELETLVALARPFAVEGEPLHEALTHAEAVLETPVEGAPEVARGIVERVDRAWRDTPRRRAAYDLRKATERVLLTRRAYTRLGVFGEACLQAELGDGRDRATVYLPEAVADSMPLFAELEVRLIVSVHARQDASATSPLALRALGVFRVP